MRKSEKGVNRLLDQTSKSTLLIIGPGPHILGGVSVVLQHRIRLLQQLRPDMKIAFVNAGTGGQSLGYSLRSLLATIRHLRKALREIRPNIIHIATGFSTIRSIVRDTIFLIYLRTVWRFKGQIVTEVHGGRPQVKHAWFFKKIFSLSDRLIFLTNVQRELFARAVGPLLYTKDWDSFSSLLPNTVTDERTVTLDTVEGLLDKRWASKPRHLLFMGRLIAAKGLLEAIALLARLDDSFRLDVAGEGPDVERARHLAVSLKVSDRVAWLGRVEGSAKEALLRQSFALVFPSRWPEGQPMTLLEAMSVGLPLVTYPGVDGVLAEMFTGLTPSPVAGTVEEMALFLRALAEDIQLYKTLGRSLFRRFREVHAPEVVGERLLSIYGVK